jgi:hypothetical protein
MKTGRPRDEKRGGMDRFRNQQGAALILLIGITATLAILAAVLVMALANQQKATAGERSRKTSFDFAEGGLDAATAVVKTQVIPSSPNPVWRDQVNSDIAAALAESLPVEATVNYVRVYDNLNPANRGIYYDSNGDHLIWIEMEATYKGKKSRARVLVSQITQNVVKSFPKAVVYSDTGIRLLDTSDVYAVDDDGITPYDPAAPGHHGAYATTIMGGGGYAPQDENGANMPAGAKNFVGNGTMNLAAPGATARSINIWMNGSVSPSVNPATADKHDRYGTADAVGLLSDYFDQAAQADLGDEAQAGETHAAAPAAPTAPTAPTAPAAPASSGTTVAPSKFSQANMTSVAGVTFNAATKTYTFANDIILSGSLEIKSGTTTGSGVFPAGTTFNFKKVYTNSSYYLKLTDDIRVTATSIRVGGYLTVNNTTATAITDTISGPIYVASNSSNSSIQGKVTLSATTFYCAGPLVVSNTATSLDQLYGAGTTGLSTGTLTATTSLYSGGALGVNNAATTTGRLWGNDTVSALGSAALTVYTSLYSSGTLAISNPTTSCGSIYANSTASITGSATVGATSLYTGSTLTISGAASTITDQFGSVYINGTGSSSIAGTVTLTTTSFFCCAGPITLSNTATSTGLFYAKDNLTLSGNTHATSSALVVEGGSDHSTSSKDFVISGATAPQVDRFGQVWVAGIADWSGTASVDTRYPSVTNDPGPMWLMILNRGGSYADHYGDTWLTGNAGTSNVAWNVSASAPSTIMCPLLSTTEKTVITGEVDFGTMTHPMVYYMMCDNDELYSNTCQWGGTGTFNGLMVIMEACLEITNGDGFTPNIRGAVFVGTEYIDNTSPSEYDITLRNASSIAYDQAIIDAVTNTAITTTTRTTKTVPGSWQQLPLE